ncbi:hypothetical protein PGH07_09080 [Sulfurovum sp. zt1-1]|uniref:Uncharacterized protein n=1 Tax=Sulfurovum zhangzhouensis TaxID=3019067 RepID=A0ABT7R0N3_9BACT|nr:hypothetical protein [Sulfurovum zhangzhouensis]MDM5272334.1 hypothetical protein [Sulfurovum zhangzhouensis]
MNKKKVNRSTMLNLKGFLFLIAFGIWVYVMSHKESFDSALEALFSYGQDTLIIISIFYVLIVLLQFFVGIEDAEK